MPPDNPGSSKHASLADAAPATPSTIAMMVPATNRRARMTPSFAIRPLLSVSVGSRPRWPSLITCELGRGTIEGDFRADVVRRSSASGLILLGLDAVLA